jgi:hypothetical protein
MRQLARQVPWLSRDACAGHSTVLSVADDLNLLPLFPIDTPPIAPSISSTHTPFASISHSHTLPIMRGALAGLSLATLATASPVLVNSIHNDAAPILSASNAKEIADNYMIKFKDHVTQNLAAQHHGWVQDLHEKTQVAKTELRKRSQTPMVDDIFSGLKHTYNIAGGLMGYAGHFDEETIEQIRRHPDVSSLAPNLGNL